MVSLFFAKWRSNLPCRISFGKGEDFWTNVFPTSLTAQFQADIVKFGKALKIIKKLEVPFALIPVHAMLRIFNFSTDFGEKMVYPLVALFFGTGNQTPYISSAILVRLQDFGSCEVLTSLLVGASLHGSQHAVVRV